MTNFKHLFIDHARWAAEVVRLKKEGSAEFENCRTVKETSANTCLDILMREYRSDIVPSNSYGDSVSFEEHYYEAVAEERVCQHCQNVRRLKAERMAASRRLGQIRSAITRVGKRLASEGARDGEA